MPNPANLFRLLNELIILLLGALLILLAVTRPIMLPARPTALMLLGAVLIYWGARAWARPQRGDERWQTTVRGASLAIVGLLVLTVPFFPLRDSGLLVGLAGAILVARGLLGGVAFARLRVAPGKASSDN
ncbi:MAG: hypothetical protein ACRD4S_10830 [Candidatus Acidiferrales bacterium]